MIETIAYILFLSCGQVIDHPIRLMPGGSIIGEAGCTKPAEINLLGKELNCKPVYVDGAHEAREPDTGWLIWDGLTPLPNERIVGANRPWKLILWTPPEVPNRTTRVGQSYFIVGNQYNNRADEWSWDGSKVIADPNVTWSCHKDAVIAGKDVNNVEISNINIIGSTLHLNGQNSVIRNVEITKTDYGIVMWRADGKMISTIDNVYIHDVNESAIYVAAGFVSVTNSVIHNIGDDWNLHNTRAAISIRDNAIVKNNIISNVGYIGINVGFDSVIKENTITGFCNKLGDGAAIYMGNSINADGGRTYVAKNNISYGIGNQSYLTGYKKCSGIYADEGMHSVFAERNKIANVNEGVHINRSYNNIFVGNECTNCDVLKLESKSSFNNIVEWE